MTHDDDLTPELRALLAAEQALPTPGIDARARVAARLSRSLGVALAPSASSPPTGATLSKGAGVAGKSLAAKIMVAAMLGGLGVGGVWTTLWLLHGRSASQSPPAPSLSPPATGATSPSASRSTAPTTLPPQPTTRAPAPADPPSLAASEADLPAEVPPPPPPRASPRPEAPSRRAHHGNLAAERALLGRAREAMQASDGARALAILDDHARRFPRGQLVEERDALRVGALWRAGDRAAAHDKAVEFARRHPDSLFLPSVERALMDPSDRSP